VHLWRGWLTLEIRRFAGTAYGAKELVARRERKCIMSYDLPPDYWVPPASSIVESGQYWQEDNKRRSEQLYRLESDLTAETRRQIEQTQQMR
jgi:hypothetical protein